MVYSSIWAKTKLTKRLAIQYFDLYGHLLQWKNYKENILEVGCGDGSITRDILYPYVKNHVQKITAIDKLDDMIKYAKEENKIGEIEFQTMDAMDKDNVEKLKGHFDHLFSFFCVHWTVDQRAFMDGFYKMLKPKGQAYITIMLDSPIHQSYVKQFKERAWSKYIPQEREVANYTENPVKYVQNVMEDVGFKVDVCTYEKNTEVIEDFSNYVRALVLMHKHTKYIPKEHLEDYIEYHIKNSFNVSKYLREPSTYATEYETMLCIASKDT